MASLWELTRPYRVGLHLTFHRLITARTRRRLTGTQPTTPPPTTHDPLFDGEHHPGAKGA